MGKQPHANGIAATVRRRVLAAPDHYWTAADLHDLPATSVARTLARLADKNLVTRVASGIYYVPKSTMFGRSVPTQPDIAAHARIGTVHPAGLTAANVLGLTTQNAARGYFATTKPWRPRALGTAHVLTRRSPLRANLSRTEGALFEVLRNRARDADVGADSVRRRLVAVVKAPGSFDRLAKAGVDEPPRVRAMLGALAQSAGVGDAKLAQLRASLNPLSRFDFGMLATLPHARRWQAA